MPGYIIKDQGYTGSKVFLLFKVDSRLSSKLLWILKIFFDCLDKSF